MPPRKKALSVVPPDAVAPPDDKKAPQTIHQAAGSSERALLVALRDRIAADLDKGVPAHALAPLSKQLREIAKEIEAIDQRAAEEEASSGPSADEDWDASAI